MSNKTSKIRTLNDELRRRAAMPSVEVSKDHVLMTQGLSALSPVDRFKVLTKVRDFDQFTEDNDPHGEHDFGSFEHEGHKIFWKIDYYDNDLQFHSPDAADPEKTTRVLTIMLAEEY